MVGVSWKTEHARYDSKKKPRYWFVPHGLMHLNNMESSDHLFKFMLVPLYHFLEKVCTHKLYHLEELVDHPFFVLPFQMILLQYSKLQFQTIKVDFQCRQGNRNTTRKGQFLFLFDSHCQEIHLIILSSIAWQDTCHLS